jgi:AAA domain
VAKPIRDGTQVQVPVVAAVERTIRANLIDVLIIDPFVASHQVQENDNNAVNAVVAAWAAIAEQTNCSIELIHHSRKTNNNETIVEDARGASALLAAARSVRTINVMTKDEAEKANIDNRRSYFRISNGKANLAPPPDNAWWCRIQSVPLRNGLLEAPGDLVGVVTAWQWPNHLADVSISDLADVKQAIEQAQWRQSSQSEDWIGYPIAKALKLNVENTAHKAKVKSLIKMWTNQGALIVIYEKDVHRKDRPFVQVGDWMKANCATSKGGAALWGRPNRKLKGGPHNARSRV